MSLVTILIRKCQLTSTLSFKCLGKTSTHEAVVKIPPPPMPEIYGWVSDEAKSRERPHTNREMMSISIDLDNPQAKMPIQANATADWFAPCLPMTLLRRP